MPPDDERIACPLGIDEQQRHLERFLDSLNSRIDILFEKVVLGNDQDPLTVSVAKLIDNQLEDRQKLSHLEKKIEQYGDRQTKDLMEIKDAIHQLGTIGLIFQKGGWKLIGILAGVFMLAGGISTWVYDKNAQPRFLRNPDQLEVLREIILETVNSDLKSEPPVHSPPDLQ